MVCLADAEVKVLAWLTPSVCGTALSARFHGTHGGSHGIAIGGCCDQCQGKAENLMMLCMVFSI